MALLHPWSTEGLTMEHMKGGDLHRAVGRAIDLDDSAKLQREAMSPGGKGSQEWPAFGRPRPRS